LDLNKPQKRMLLKFSAYGFLKNLQFFDPFMLLFFTEAKGLSYTQFGALIAVREISVMILEIPTGIIADVTGRRRAMMIAFGSYILSFAVFTAADSFWLFVPAMILFGAGEAFRSGTHKSMIMQHLDLEGLSDQKVHYYGRTRSASRLGSAAVALLAAAVVYWAGYEAIFAATIVPYVLGFALMMSYPAELDGDRKKRARLRDLVQHTGESFREIWHTPQLKRVLCNAAVFNAFFRVAKDYLQPILKAAALSLPLLAVGASANGRAAVLIGPVYFAVHLNAFASSRASGRLADRVGHLGTTLNVLYRVFAALCVAAGCVLILSETTSNTALHYSMLGLAGLIMFLFYTLYNLRRPVVTGFLSDLTDKQRRATVLSVQSQFRALVAALLAPALGFVADNGPHLVRSVSSHALGFSPFVFLLAGLVLFVAEPALRLKQHRVPEEDEQEATAGAAEP